MAPNVVWPNISPFRCTGEIFFFSITAKQIANYHVILYVCRLPVEWILSHFFLSEFELILVVAAASAAAVAATASAQLLLFTILFIFFFN